MRQVVDRTVSKKPFNVEDESEITRNSLDVENIGQSIYRMGRIDEEMCEDPEYRVALEVSKERTLQLVDHLLGMKLSADTLPDVATVMGRLGERRRLTLELEGIRTFEGNVLERMRARVIAVGQSISERVKKNNDKRKVT